MSGEISLSHKLDCSAVAFASEQDLLLLASLVAPETAGQNDRAPIDLVAVLDRCYISFIAVLHFFPCSAHCFTIQLCSDN